MTYIIIIILLTAQQIDRWTRGIEATGDTLAVFVVRDEGKVIGFVAPDIMDGQRRIGAIYVFPETQGKGVGSTLLKRAIDWHGKDENIYLHVASYNQKAIGFYERNGFEHTGAQVVDQAAAQNGSKPIPKIEMVRRTKTANEK